MQFKQSIINFCITLLNKQLWSDTCKLVADVEKSKSLTNKMKHKRVKSDLMVLFDNVSRLTLDFAIKLAVAWLKSQADDIMA